MEKGKKFYSDLSMKESNNKDYCMSIPISNIGNHPADNGLDVDIESRPPIPSILHVNPINILWCLLSFIISGMSVFAFLQPFWLIEPRSPHYLGIYSYCIKDSRYIGQERQICALYGGYFSIHNLPSLEWKITCVLFGTGCLLHIICAISGISLLCIWTSVRRKTACIIGFIQAIAVIFCVVGLLLFPMGFHNKFVQHYCFNNLGRFHLGKCETGWGLLLAGMGTALSIFCPILAQFFDVWVCEKPPFHMTTSVANQNRQEASSPSIYKIELAEATEQGNYADMYPKGNQDTSPIILGQQRNLDECTSPDDYTHSSSIKTTATTTNETDSTTTLANQMFYQRFSPNQQPQLPPLPMTSVNNQFNLSPYQHQHHLSQMRPIYSPNFLINSHNPADFTPSSDA